MAILSQEETAVEARTSQSQLEASVASSQYLLWPTEVNNCGVIQNLPA